MAEKTVVSDASPLIGLAAAGGFELLLRLFGAVTVTSTVRREVAKSLGVQVTGAAGILLIARKPDW
jgi:predicted nucleic acid-binding protein